MLWPDYQNKPGETVEALFNVIIDQDARIRTRLNHMSKDLGQTYGVTKTDWSQFMQLREQCKFQEAEEKYPVADKFIKDKKFAQVFLLELGMDKMRKEVDIIDSILQGAESETDRSQAAVRSLIEHADKLHQIEHVDLGAIAGQIAAIQDVPESSSSQRTKADDIWQEELDKMFLRGKGRGHDSDDDDNPLMYEKEYYQQ